MIDPFSPLKVGTLTLKNRFIRSATFEGAADINGYPTEKYIKIIKELCEGGVGTIITGFTYFRADGVALEPGQAGIDSDDKISTYRSITDITKKNDVKIFMQLSHTGRQTTTNSIGSIVRGVSKRSSWYFNNKVVPYSELELDVLLEDFSKAAYRAKQSGFNGIQLHLAHGYLLHQFLSKKINNRKDRYGDNLYFIKSLITAIYNLCGENFPVWIKISGDSGNYEFEYDLSKLIDLLNTMKVGLIEVSYGTMEMPLNIFRGKSLPINEILDFNPRFKSDNNFYRFILKNIIFPIIKCGIIPFSSCYNLDMAKIVKDYSEVQISVVGGINSLKNIGDILESSIDLISICRPLVCEPYLINRWKVDRDYISKCTYCNVCGVLADSNRALECKFKGR